MSFFSSIVKYVQRVVGGFKKHHPETAKALEAWGEQFLSEAGSLAAELAAAYGQKIISGKISITDAKNEVLEQLHQMGIKATEELAEVVFNALRTHANAAR